MSVNKQTLFWIGAMAALLLFVFVLHEILLPFVVGAAIAYFLDPLADRLEDLGFSRLWATIVIVLVFGFLVTLSLIFVLPLLVDQLIDLASRLPGYFQYLRDLTVDYLERWFGEKWTSQNLGLDGTVKDFAQKAAGWAGQLFSSVWSGGLAVVNFFALIVITPVVTFYLLLDWDRMMQHISDWLPRDHADTIHQIGRDINDVISGFVRGQMTVLVILGVFYVIGLSSVSSVQVAGVAAWSRSSTPSTTWRRSIGLRVTAALPA